MAAISTATPLDFTATGAGAATRPLAQVVDEFVLASNFAGYDENGEATGTDSAAAIMAADAVARSRSRELVLTRPAPDSRPSSSSNAPTRWRMHGQHFKPGFPRRRLLHRQGCVAPRRCDRNDPQRLWHHPR